MRNKPSPLVLSIALLLMATLSLVTIAQMARPVHASTSGPVALSTTSDKTAFESAFQNFGFYAQGRYWVFYEDTSVNCENMGGCFFYTSSTDALTWTTPTNVGIHVTDSDWSIVTDSVNAFYVRYDEPFFESQCGLPILMGSGVLSSNGSITWQPEQTVKTGSAQDVFLNDVIRLDSNNQLWIAYQDANAGGCGGTGTQTPNIIHSNGTNYASWTGDMTLSTDHSNNWDIDLATLSGGQVFAGYWINGLDLHGRLFNGTAWGADEQISSPSDSTDVNSFVFASGANISAIWYDTNTETLRFATRASLGQWSISNIGHGEAKSAASLGRYSLPITATYDPIGSRFYVYWFNNTGGVIDQWSGSGSNWTMTPNIFTTASESGEYTISSYFQAAGVGTNDVLGLIWVDQAALPYHLNFGLVTVPSPITPLNATFTYSPSSPSILQSVQFTGSASGGTQPYSYAWDFGDGSTGAGQSAGHSYLLPGAYTVTLTVTDASGQTFTTSQTVAVNVLGLGL